MITDEMRAHLREGEEILWSAQPVRGKLMDEDNKGRIIRNSCIILGILIAFLIVYFIKNAGETNVLLVVVLVAVFAVIASEPFSTFAKLRKMHYVVTNRGIFTYDGQNFKDLPYDLVDAMRIVTGSDGRQSLCIGSPTVKLSLGKLRQSGVNGVSEHINGSNVFFPVFYNVENAEQARKLILEQKSLIKR